MSSAFGYLQTCDLLYFIDSFVIHITSKTLNFNIIYKC